MLAAERRSGNRGQSRHTFQIGSPCPSTCGCLSKLLQPPFELAAQPPGMLTLTPWARTPWACNAGCKPARYRRHFSTEKSADAVSHARLRASRGGFPQRRDPVRGAAAHNIDFRNNREDSRGQGSVYHRPDRGRRTRSSRIHDENSTTPVCVMSEWSRDWSS